MSNPNLKQQIIAACHQILTQKYQSAKHMIQSAETARNNETKSSAGDKYETGRAMMQIERDKAEFQLFKITELQAKLNNIEGELRTDHVALGSLAITDEFNYYISIPLGKVMVDNKPNYAISVISPLGTALKGSRKGDSITFQNRTIQILDIV